MPHDVFISHSSVDKKLADALCHFIEQRKIKCWIAPRDIPPGATWAGAIVDAIRKSKVMALILSSHANSSQEVAKEVGLASLERVFILPIRVESVDLEGDLLYHLSRTHWLDALAPPIEQHLVAIATKIETHLGVSEGTRGRQDALNDKQNSSTGPANGAAENAPIQESIADFTAHPSNAFNSACEGGINEMLCLANAKDDPVHPSLKERRGLIAKKVLEVARKAISAEGAEQEECIRGISDLALGGPQNDCLAAPRKGLVLALRSLTFRALGASGDRRKAIVSTLQQLALGSVLDEWGRAAIVRSGHSEGGTAAS